MGINGGYNQMFCLKLKELRNLNSVKLALQARPTSPFRVSRRFWKEKKSGRGVEIKNQKRNKMLKAGFSCPFTILTSLGLVAGAIGMTTGERGCLGCKSLYLCVTLSYELRPGSFATSFTVGFQSQCQAYGFVFLLTNTFISAKVMLFWLCRTSNEYFISFLLI